MKFSPSLLLLLLLPIALSLAQQPLSPLPGMDQIGLGFDIVTGKDTGLPVVLPQFSPAFSPSGTPSSSWQNPFTGASYTFPAALQVQDAQASAVEAYLFHSSYEYAQWQALQAGLSFPPAGVFSLSASTQSSKSVFAAQDALLVVARQRASLYRTTLVPASSLLLAPAFLADLAALPPQSDPSSPQAYATFISFYGTHFVAGATAGGEALAAYAVSSSYAAQSSDLVVAASARVAFNNLKLGLGGLFSRNASAAFYSASQVVDSYLLGGDPVYHANVSDWARWIDSVPLDPAPVQRSLLPIATLIADADKRAGYEQAVQAYLAANNNSASSPLVQASQLPVAGCGCANSYGSGCPNGWLIQGYPVTGNDQDPKLPHLCCAPCFSFASAFTNAMLPPPSTATFQDIEAKLHQEKKEFKSKENKSNEKSEKMMYQKKKSSFASNVSSSTLPILPMSVLGAAYDVVRGAVVGSQVIAFTTSQNKTWTYPFNQSLTYLVPDQVNVVDDSASPYASQLFMSAANATQAKAESLGISFSYGMFSLSFDVSQTFASYQNNQAITGLATQSEVFYEVSVFPASLPTAFFTDFVTQTLPAQYDAPVYADFLAQFGTHFIKSVAIGGQAVLEATISEHYYATSSTTDIQTNLKALFYSLVGYGADHGSNYSTFQQETFAQFSVLGGNQAIVAQADGQWFPQWMQSVPLAPTAISYTLEPITSLIADPTLQANVQLAIDTYLLTASEQTQQMLDAYVFPLTSSFTAPTSGIQMNQKEQQKEQQNEQQNEQKKNMEDQNDADGKPMDGSTPHYMRRDTTNCDTQGMYATSWNQHDGSYIAYPVTCNNIYLIKQPSNTLFQQLSWCNCNSYPTNMCPPGNFVRGFGNYYGGIEGDYPQPPIECCSACISLNQQ